MKVLLAVTLLACLGVLTAKAQNSAGPGATPVAGRPRDSAQLIRCYQKVSECQDRLFQADHLCGGIYAWLECAREDKECGDVEADFIQRVSDHLNCDLSK